MTDSINAFVKILKSVVNLYEIHSIQPTKISDARKARLFLSEFPDVAVEELGPYLYEYRDAIKNGDHDELFRALEKNRDKIPEDIKRVLTPVKEEWYSLGDDKLKKDIKVAFKKLLRIYLDILTST